MPRTGTDATSLEPNPLWYKDAIIYQLHPRAFFDSNGDGIGDFRGMTQKLDYIQDLGVTAIWILPFYPSPLRDDGYDIADYSGVHPDYGTIPDVRRFVREAHNRGLRVITELVCNHTSDQHPWFQRARHAAPGSAARNYYVWSDDPEKYSEARIIFKDFESSNWTWDPVAEAYYWHRFYHHQPDLNFDNPQRAQGHPFGDGLLAADGCRRSATRRDPVSVRARRNELRESAGDASISEGVATARRLRASTTECFWQRRISGQKTRSPTSVTATNVICRFTSR